MVVRNEYPLATILPMSGYQLSATGGTGEYTWNEGGMLRSDSARGITDIEYHPMGQPQKVTFADGGYLYYTYRADGTLASVKTYSVLPGASKPTQVSARSYCGNFVFENDSLATVNFSGGYFDGKGAPHYRHADFQGNITIVTDQDGDIEQHTGYYPYGEPWREPDGQPYLYGSKERMRDNGLNYYDFRARRLNAAICLWSTPDPLALDYTALSPYSSCAANPVRFIDPSGKEIRFNGDKKLIDKVQILLQEMVGDYATVSIIDGKVSMAENQPSNDGQNISGEDLSKITAVKYLNRFIQSEIIIEFDLVTDDENVHIANCDTKTIDISDVENADNNEPATPSSILLHEIAEQHSLKKRGDNDKNKAHADAINIENAIYTKQERVLDPMSDEGFYIENGTLYYNVPYRTKYSPPSSKKYDYKRIYL